MFSYHFVTRPKRSSYPQDAIQSKTQLKLTSKHVLSTARKLPDITQGAHALHICQCIIPRPLITSSYSSKQICSPCFVRDHISCPEYFI